MRKCEVPGLTICAVGVSSPLSLSLSLSFIVLTHATTTLREGSLSNLYFSSFIFSFFLSETLN
jgi:hypothetical protein